MSRNRIIAAVLAWRTRHLKYRRWILILSFVVGILSGFAAVLLKNIVHHTAEFVYQITENKHLSILLIAMPLVGILITVLFVKYVIKDNIGHGVSKILHAISTKNSRIKPHNTYSSMLASTFTVGFGGSVGLEAPIVLTGSAIGSNISRLFRLNYKSTTLLLGCGAAGAIAGIFKAPIAAIVFGLEVLMLDLTMWSLIPLLISAVSGASVAYFFMGENVIFSFNLEESFQLSTVPFFVLLGIFTGLISAAFTKGTLYMEGFISKIKNTYSRLIAGGIILGLLVFLFPPLYGEGYETLRLLLNGDLADINGGTIFSSLIEDPVWLLFFLFMVIFTKIIASSSTTGSGGVGGIFAPSLFIGGISGFFFSRLINMSQFYHLSEKNFALVGMAGVMAGVMYAPLTGIFLIAEITGGYQLFLPLIIVSTISYLTVLYFEEHSIYHKRLAQRGELITHDKDRAVLRLINLKKVVEKDLKSVSPDQTLRDLVKVVAKSKRNIFPVIKEDKTLVGVVLLDNVREILFKPELYDETIIEELMIYPPALIFLSDSMEAVMKKFSDTDAWNLPVVDENEKYIGFISKSKLFSIYRKWLKDISND